MVDKGIEFYNRSRKSYIEKNDMEMYSTHTEGKSVVAERFIKILRTKFMSVRIQYQKIRILIN